MKPCLKDLLSFPQNVSKLDYIRKWMDRVTPIIEEIQSWRNGLEISIETLLAQALANYDFSTAISGQVVTQLQEGINSKADINHTHPEYLTVNDLPESVDVSNKVNKVIPAEAHNIPTLASDGSLEDSGTNLSDLATSARVSTLEGKCSSILTYLPTPNVSILGTKILYVGPTDTYEFGKIYECVREGSKYYLTLQFIILDTPTAAQYTTMKDTLREVWQVDTEGFPAFSSLDGTVERFNVTFYIKNTGSETAQSVMNNINSFLFTYQTRDEGELFMVQNPNSNNLVNAGTDYYGWTTEEVNVDVSNKEDKPASFTQDHLISFGSNGELDDSGINKQVLNHVVTSMPSLAIVTEGDEYLYVGLSSNFFLQLGQTYKCKTKLKAQCIVLLSGYLHDEQETSGVLNYLKTSHTISGYGSYILHDFTSNPTTEVMSITVDIYPNSASVIIPNFEDEIITALDTAVGPHTIHLDLDDLHSDQSATIRKEWAPKFKQELIPIY